MPTFIHVTVVNISNKEPQKNTKGHYWII